MIRLYDGRKVVDLVMREEGFDGFEGVEGFFRDEYDEVEFFADGGCHICHDFIDSDQAVYAVEDVDYCIDYAKDWEKCCGDFAYDFEEYLGKRSLYVYPMAHVLIVGGANDGSVAFVGTLKDAREYARIAEGELSEEELGVVGYVVYDEDGEEE